MQNIQRHIRNYLLTLLLSVAITNTFLSGAQSLGITLTQQQLQKSQEEVEQYLTQPNPQPLDEQNKLSYFFTILISNNIEIEKKPHAENLKKFLHIHPHSFQEYLNTIKRFPLFFSLNNADGSSLIPGQYILTDDYLRPAFEANIFTRHTISLDELSPITDKTTWEKLAYKNSPTTQPITPQKSLALLLTTLPIPHLTDQTIKTLLTKNRDNIRGELKKMESFDEAIKELPGTKPIALELKITFTNGGDITEYLYAENFLDKINDLQISLAYLEEKQGTLEFSNFFEKPEILSPRDEQPPTNVTQPSNIIKQGSIIPTVTGITASIAIVCGLWYIKANYRGKKPAMKPISAISYQNITTKNQPKLQHSS